MKLPPPPTSTSSKPHLPCFFQSNRTSPPFYFLPLYLHYLLNYDILPTSLPFPTLPSTPSLPVPTLHPPFHTNPSNPPNQSIQTNPSNPLHQISQHYLKITAFHTITPSHHTTPSYLNQKPTKPKTRKKEGEKQTDLPNLE